MAEEQTTFACSGFTHHPPCNREMIALAHVHVDQMAKSALQKNDDKSCSWLRILRTGKSLIPFRSLESRALAEHPERAELAEPAEPNRTPLSNHLLHFRDDLVRLQQDTHAALHNQDSNLGSSVPMDGRTETGLRVRRP